MTRLANPDWYIRRRQAQIRPYKEHEQRQRLRKRLLSANPRCDNCGRPLQAEDPELASYACVVEFAERLSCRRCVNTVIALAKAEDAESSVIAFAADCGVQS